MKKCSASFLYVLISINLFALYGRVVLVNMFLLLRQMNAWKMNPKNLIVPFLFYFIDESLKLTISIIQTFKTEINLIFTCT